MNTQYQDHIAHEARLHTNALYHKWYTLLEGSGYEFRGRGIPDPYTFLMQIYEAGYSPREALDFFKIASAEALARIEEQSKAFTEAKNYLHNCHGYYIEHVPNWQSNLWEVRHPGRSGFNDYTSDEIIREAQYVRSKHTNNHGQDDRLTINSNLSSTGESEEA